MYKHNCNILPLGVNDMPTAATICAAAMNENPLHVKVFGANPDLRQRRLRRMFPALLTYVKRKGELYGAFIDGKLIGVLGMLPPNACQPTLRDLIQLLPRMISANSPLGGLRLAIWLGTWARIDPKQPHWHLGPLAIAPQWQYKGVGTQMIEFTINQCAAEHLYLETDKQSNVDLYQRFGFKTLATPTILGIPSWVMIRST
ncbi:GNAT family N-acetyltransferase [Nitrosomonas mobilis]|uniref:GCN5-related N-acetyltransferase n=1 Tax=Nitrosomonas mobilis TaxID=51642 RepID=A0A1G5SI91_9PROT|nr:GNAT family N-acetyltransferase [Nitrosomonas mobilis]SCZ86707.1 GCN5-related N-acetyltransferase [Nitrosomonas mobilis]